ncbi:MAG: hypothetical protein O2816_20470 [Planctomycetota bacterium]|nr:hypothetical protein [Planctomycetota bacterium]
MVLSSLPTLAALALLLAAALRPRLAQAPVPTEAPPPSVQDVRGVPLAGARISLEVDGVWQRVGLTGPMGELLGLPDAGRLVVSHSSYVPARLQVPTAGQTVVLQRAGHLSGSVRGVRPGAEVIAWPAEGSMEAALEASRRGDPTVPRCRLDGVAFVLRELDRAKRWNVGVVRCGALHVLARNLEVGRADLRFSL